MIQFQSVFFAMWSFLIEAFSMLFVDAIECCFLFIMSSWSPSNESNFFTLLQISVFLCLRFNKECFRMFDH